MENIFEHAFPLEKSDADFFSKEIRDVAGFVVPEMFIKFCQKFDGSKPSLNMFDAQDPTSDGMYGMGRFFRLGDRELLHRYEEERVLYGDKYLPISEDGGGNLLMLNMQTGAVEMSLFDEGLAPRFSKVADNFNDFLDVLYYDGSDMI